MIPDRVCPGCLLELPATSDYWYLRPDGKFRSSCRTCIISREVQRQRDRRNGVPPKRTPCACCRRYLPISERHGDDGFCAWCSTVLTEVQGHLGEALALLGKTRAHNADEEARKLRWKVQGSPQHCGLTLTDWKPAFRHKECLIRERTLEAVVKHLAKRGAEE